MMTAANAPVTTNVTIVVVTIFPARLRLDMLAIALAMDEKTIGTTMQNMRLMNTVPSGSRHFAPGQIAPSTHPRTIAESMMQRNP